MTAVLTETQPRAAITTVLFTDLVDSIELLQQVGDEQQRNPRARLAARPRDDSIHLGARIAPYSPTP
jgi:hypothetical protein